MPSKFPRSMFENTKIGLKWCQVDFFCYRQSEGPYSNKVMVTHNAKSAALYDVRTVYGDLRLLKSDIEKHFGLAHTQKLNEIVSTKIIDALLHHRLFEQFYLVAVQKGLYNHYDEFQAIVKTYPIPANNAFWNHLKTLLALILFEKDKLFFFLHYSMLNWQYCFIINVIINIKLILI